LLPSFCSLHYCFSPWCEKLLSDKERFFIIYSIDNQVPYNFSNAQQDPLYTQYYNNFSLINPAYSGSHGLFTATANIRSQWAGEAGSPETQTLSLHGPVGEKVGLGLSIVNDKVFVSSETHVYADFSYSIDLTEASTLAFGLKAGGSFLNVDLLKLGIENDPLFSENLNEFNPNIGAGAFYYTDRFYASISTVNILQTTHYDKNSTVVSNASKEMIFEPTPKSP
jgi:type IX secretion system PorP/SprF family membrane protein